MKAFGSIPHFPSGVKTHCHSKTKFLNSCQGSVGFSDADKASYRICQAPGFFLTLVEKKNLHSGISLSQNQETARFLHGGIFQSLEHWSSPYPVVILQSPTWESEQIMPPSEHHPF